MFYRQFYTYLSTLLRGLGDWAVLLQQRGDAGGGGIPQGNMAVSKTDEEVLVRDVFVARIGVGVGEGDRSSELDSGKKGEDKGRGKRGRG